MKNNRPMKKKDVHARKLGSEWLLYDPEKEKLHILNSTAEFVWRLCDGNRDISDIKAEMREEFDVSDENKLDQDLSGILSEFGQIGVLKGS